MEISIYRENMLSDRQFLKLYFELATDFHYDPVRLSILGSIKHFKYGFIKIWSDDHIDIHVKKEYSQISNKDIIQAAYEII